MVPVRVLVLVSVFGLLPALAAAARLLHRRIQDSVAVEVLEQALREVVLLVPRRRNLQDVPLHREVELAQVDPDVDDVGAADLVDVLQVELKIWRSIDRSPLCFSIFVLRVGGRRKEGSFSPLGQTELRGQTV